jgi:hypothetical protein
MSATGKRRLLDAIASSKGFGFIAHRHIPLPGRRFENQARWILHRDDRGVRHARRAAGGLAARGVTLLLQNIGVPRKACRSRRWYAGKNLKDLHVIMVQETRCMQAAYRRPDFTTGAAERPRFLHLARPSRRRVDDLLQAC